MANLESNTIHNKVENLNLDIRLFLEHFANYREKSNYIDKNLVKSLNRVVQCIDEFLSSDPVEVPTREETIINCHLGENRITMMLFCTLCKEHLAPRANTVQRHINSPNHLTNYVQLQQRRNGEATTEKTSKSLNGEISTRKVIMQQPTEAQMQAAYDKSVEKSRQKAAKKERKRDQKKKETQNLPKKARSFINQNCAAFIDESVKIANKLKEMPLYNDIRNTMRRSIQPIYPDVKISFFGSRICGLGSPQSDLDVFVNIGDVYNLYNERKIAINKKLEKVREVLKSNKEEWTQFQSVTNARVPILRVFNIKCHIDCDLSFSNGLGDCNTQLVKHIFTILPLAQKLSLYIKKWFLFSGIGLITNYAQVLMVIFYLQTKRILPPIKEFQTNLEPLLIGPWLGNFVPRQLKDFKLETVEDNFPTFMKHLKGFFEYYGKTFDFHGSVVCPLLGTPVYKSNFNTLKGAFERYHNFYVKNPEENGFQIECFMCVQDPLELNHNVCKAVPLGTLNLMRNFCDLTAEWLKKPIQNVDDRKI